MDVIERIRRLMDHRGWTTYRLAKESGLSDGTVRNMFNRNTVPSIPTLEAICASMGITLSQFFADHEMVELSPELKDLFDGWADLTAAQKEAVQSVVNAFNADK